MDQKEQKRQKHKGHYLICIDFINVHCNICKRNCPFQLRYVQMDATTPNAVGPTMLGVVVSVCKFDRFQTVCDHSRQHVTRCTGRRKNVRSCLPTMLRPFARGFTGVIKRLLFDWFPNCSLILLPVNS